MINREKSVVVVGIREKWMNKGTTVKTISRKMRNGECTGIKAI
jgi:hypothetical protein